MCANASNPSSPNGGSPRRKARIWAFAGGKGGVGRSLLAANLAVQLARDGQRVALIDADIDGPTVRAFLGIPASDPGLRLLFEDKSLDLTRCFQRIPPDELFFAGGMENAVTGVPSTMDRLAIAIPRLDMDHVILDLGSTRTPTVQKLFRIADLGLIVVTPEALSLQPVHAYFSQLVRRHPDGKGPVSQDLPRLGILVNRIRSEDEAFNGVALRSGLRKLLGLHATLLGSIPHDDAVSQALMRGRPFSLQYPNSPAAKAIGALLRGLAVAADHDAGVDGAPARLESADHYEILEVPKQATHRQIQSAYERLRRIYRTASPFVPGSLDPRRLQEITDRIEQAYRALIFVETRREYDRQTLKTDTATPTASPTTPPNGNGDHLVEVAGEDFPMPEGDFTGEALRRIRAARDISLETICEITKIRKFHLECIEAEQFSELPAAVFLRGFLRAYAQCMGLDTDEVCRDYMSRYDEWERTPEDSPLAAVPEDL
jgi:flagellar biosynthesis protein FlhG